MENIKQVQNIIREYDKLLRRARHIARLLKLNEKNPGYSLCSVSLYKNFIEYDYQEISNTTHFYVSIPLDYLCMTDKEIINEINNPY